MKNVKIKSRNKFVIALTVKNLIEDGFTFEENEFGYLLVKNEDGKLEKLFNTEKGFQEWIDEVSQNY